MKIEINDSLPELLEEAIEGTKQLLLDYLEENPDIEECPCLSNDIDYDGRFHELIDGIVPIYTSDIKDIFYLHGDEIEEAFDNAGIGSKEDKGWPAGWKAAAIYCWLEQEVWEWWHDNAENIFEDWKEEQQTEEGE